MQHKFRFKRKITILNVVETFIRITDFAAVTVFAYKHHPVCFRIFFRCIPSFSSLTNQCCLCDPGPPGSYTGHWIFLSCSIKHSVNQLCVNEAHKLTGSARTDYRQLGQQGQTENYSGRKMCRVTSHFAA